MTRLEDLPDEWERSVAAHYEHSQEAIAVRGCAEELREALRWIPVAERLPEVRNARYQVYELGDVDLGLVDDDGEWWRAGWRLTRVTHWRELPEGPKP